MGYEEMAVQISGGKINTYTQKRVFQLNIFLFQCVSKEQFRSLKITGGYILK